MISHGARQTTSAYALPAAPARTSGSSARAARKAVSPAIQGPFVTPEPPPFTVADPYTYQTSVRYSWMSGEWADGTPAPFVTNFLGAAQYAGDAPGGWSFSTRADPFVRVMTVRLGSHGSGVLRAQLSDDSCTVYETVVSDNDQVVTLFFSSASPDQTLNVTYFGDSHDITLGAIAVKPLALMTLGFETSDDPTRSAHTVTVDNPLVFTNQTLKTVSTQWGGLRPQEVQTTAIGVANYNSDFWFESFGGDGAAGTNGLSLAASVMDRRFSGPNSIGMWSANGGATHETTFRTEARGLRVGYTPMEVELRTRVPASTSSGATSTVSLDPSVALVPVQVVALILTRFGGQSDYAAVAAKCIFNSNSIGLT